MLRTVLGGFLLLFTLNSACGADPTPQAIEQFEKSVRPVFDAHCVSCHGRDAKKIRGGLTMTSRSLLLTGGDTGPAMVPGDAAKSLLIDAIESNGDLKMPPKGKLAAAEIAAIRTWIDAGAVWPNAQEPAAPAIKPTGELFTTEQKQFWAFQPIAKSTVPNIDAFIQTKLTEQKLTPAAPAELGVLVRRMTFDLTGLPPTPEELDAVSADAAKRGRVAALDTLIEKLLANPAYGERWGRHWLDVARYADSNGLDENTAFGNAWKYRDYVIKSFNVDKPYDQFVREQLAGDLLPKTDDAKLSADRLTATGYLVLGAKLLAEPDKQKMLLDIADEQLDTVGKGLLGLTLGCARCHDHKFDPIPTRDYYSLLSIFTSTRTMQGLGTVAKAHERAIIAADRPANADTLQKELDTARKEVNRIEKAFGKTDPKDNDTRGKLHIEAEKHRADIARLTKLLPAPESVLCVEEGTAAAYNTAPRNLYVQVRGNYLTAGEEAPANFLRILQSPTAKEWISTSSGDSAKAEAQKIRYGTARPASGRLQLAEWIVNPSNPLTARVMANRVWHYHFGQGLVRSTDNFGRLGDRPSHPELLDFLAQEFMAHGWSVKHLHRLILRSSTYQQSTINPAASAADAENRWLAHYPRRRLEAEAIRDAILAVSGTLDRTMGGTLYRGPNLDYVGNVAYTSTRRTVYLPVIRNKLYPFLQTFDFPEPSVMNGQRVNTIVAPQALYFLNNPLMIEQASAFAKRLLALPAPDRERAAYRAALGREPTPTELTNAKAFREKYTTLLNEPDDAKRELAIWQAWCQMLFASNEFLTLN